MKTVYSFALIAFSVFLASFLAPNVNAQTSARKPGKRVKGTVKWFNDAKKFGFLTSENGEDVFVDKAAAKGSLVEGACVTFEIKPTPKGPAAKNIRKCPGGESPYVTKPKPLNPTLPKIPASELP